MSLRLAWLPGYFTLWGINPLFFFVDIYPFKRIGSHSFKRTINCIPGQDLKKTPLKIQDLTTSFPMETLTNMFVHKELSLAFNHVSAEKSTNLDLPYLLQLAREYHEYVSNNTIVLTKGLDSYYCVPATSRFSVSYQEQCAFKIHKWILSYTHYENYIFLTVTLKPSDFDSILAARKHLSDKWARMWDCLLHSWRRGSHIFDKNYRVVHYQGFTPGLKPQYLKTYEYQLETGKSNMIHLHALICGLAYIDANWLRSYFGQYRINPEIIKFGWKGAYRYTMKYLTKSLDYGQRFNMNRVLNWASKTRSYSNSRLPKPLGGGVYPQFHYQFPLCCDANFQVGVRHKAIVKLLPYSLVSLSSTTSYMSNCDMVYCEFGLSHVCFHYSPSPSSFHFLKISPFLPLSVPFFTSFSSYSFIESIPFLSTWVKLTYSKINHDELTQLRNLKLFYARKLQQLDKVACEGINLEPVIFRPGSTAAYKSQMNQLAAQLYGIEETI